jgi:hypothetical protein
MLAYGRIYPEPAPLFDEIAGLGMRSFLVTDILAATLRRRVDLVLPAAPGQADMLSMHTATLGFVGIAAKRPSETLTSLNARGKLAGKSMKLPMPQQFPRNNSPVR